MKIYKLTHFNKLQDSEFRFSKVWNFCSMSLRRTHKTYTRMFHHFHYTCCKSTANNSLKRDLGKYDYIQGPDFSIPQDRRLQKNFFLQELPFNVDHAGKVWSSAKQTFFLFSFFKRRMSSSMSSSLPPASVLSAARRRVLASFRRFLRSFFSFTSDQEPLAAFKRNMCKFVHD